jgi:hypothetical protein
MTYISIASRSKFSVSAGALYIWYIYIYEIERYKINYGYLL